MLDFVDRRKTHSDVAASLLHHERHAASHRTHSLEHWTAAHLNIGYDQVLNAVAASIVLLRICGIANGTLQNLLNRRAPRCGWNFKMFSASSAYLPRIKFATSRTLRELMRAFR